MTEYEEKITSTFKDIGFKISPSKAVDRMHTVSSEDNEFIGYLIVNDVFCTIGNKNYSIPFDDAEINRSGDLNARGVTLFRSGIYAGSINL